MSTKTIAVESGVYARLAMEKRESESFTKTIARLLNVAAESHTGACIASTLTAFTPLPDSDANQMLAIVRENRADEKWPQHDVR